MAERYWVPSPVLTDNGNEVQCAGEQCIWEPRGIYDSSGGWIWECLQCSVCGWWKMIHQAGHELGWTIDRGDEED